MTELTGLANSFLFGELVAMLKNEESEFVLTAFSALTLQRLLVALL